MERRLPRAGRRALRTASLSWIGWLALVGPLAGCGAGVNEDLVATSTPYPVRSPVAVEASPDGAAGSPEVAAFVEAGRSALAGGDAVSAERAFDRALVRAPSDPAALLGRAEARLRLGDLAGAHADLDALSRATIEDAELLLARGELLLRFGDHARAAVDFDRAIARDPGLAAAFAGRARAILAGAAGDDGRYEQALADLARAFALDPASRDALLGPAMVLVDRAEFDGDPADWRRAGEELAAVEERVATDPRWSALSARVQLALGDPEQARGTLAEALRGRPRGPDLARLRAAEAEIALARSAWDAAATAAESAIAADPLAWEARYALVLALLGNGDSDAALQAADELVRLLPGDGRGQYLRGLALAEQGDAAAARAALEAAAAALPASAVYQARVAEALDGLDAGWLASPEATPTPLVRLRMLDRATPTAGVVRRN